MRKILFLLLLAFPCTSRIAAQDIHFIGKRSVDTCHAKANCKNPILWKLKTNLLYDAFVVPNISAEMHFGRTASMLWEQPIRGCRQLFGYIYHVKGWHKVVLHL